ncbi:hypothetical protein [Vibrio sp. MEBiC08052]|uniref:hypothetical protein n=1 Tax=Vibrio sp. MEBiC08052 TaxID=1761910 RepID=UPI000740687A|nr:hypothetical protein [Vibrio sp. MEBiC08052]KUI97282.1 hypothetical protein VRK_34710 [Vibrio sp. MEBiC08052]
MVQSAVKKIDLVDHTKALVNLIDNISRICHAHYEHGFSAKILQNHVENAPSLIEKQVVEQIRKNQNIETEELVDERQKLLERIMITPNGRIPKPLVSYALGLIRLPERFIEEFSIPLSSTPLARIISFNFRDMDENDFNDAVKDTEKFILSSESKSYFDWIKALDAYHYLIEHHYIDKDIEQLIIQAKNIISEYDFFERWDSSVENRYFERTINERLWSDKIIKLHQELFPAFKQKDEIYKSSIFQESFVRSWYEVSNKIYQTYDTKPFLNKFNLDEVVSGIIDNWTINESIIFGQYLSSRYNISNIYQFLEPEFEIVKDLQKKIKKEIDEIDSSMNKGKLTELLGYIDKTVIDIINAETRSKLASQNEK